MIIYLFHPEGQIIGYCCKKWNKKIKLAQGAAREFLKRKIRQESEDADLLEVNYVFFRVNEKGDVLIESAMSAQLLLTGEDAGEFLDLLREKYYLL